METSTYREGELFGAIRDFRSALSAKEHVTASSRAEIVTSLLAMLQEERVSMSAMDASCSLCQRLLKRKGRKGRVSNVEDFPSDFTIEWVPLYQTFRRFFPMMGGRALIGDIPHPPDAKSAVLRH